MRARIIRKHHLEIVHPHLQFVSISSLTKIRTRTKDVESFLFFLYIKRFSTDPSRFLQFLLAFFSLDILNAFGEFKYVTPRPVRLASHGCLFKRSDVNLFAGSATSSFRMKSLASSLTFLNCSSGNCNVKVGSSSSKSSSKGR